VVSPAARTTSSAIPTTPSPAVAPNPDEQP
jgi:hypothetical protein